ncbi:hypothetical protein CVT26_014403 [Gymnopilus dilepis]|uniref:DUF6534 domain-containing protein n=1 Tax=Gymnopilus dilepis TaxID=231916 RepID=A0A409Y7K3_9AGAR|nr:hypothetical protein CVT26_014403 [Gymnopilus dilepis]
MPGTSLLFGPLLLGVILNAMLYGVSQVFVVDFYTLRLIAALPLGLYRPVFYLPANVQKGPKVDPVLYLFILETANTVFDIGLVFEPLVLNYGDPSSITVSPIMIIADPLVTVMISLPVQLFIAWRIKIITSSWFMPIIIGFFGVSAFIGGIAVTISVSLIREWANFHQFEGAVITWLAGSAVADLLITVSLSLSLYRRKTGVKATDDKISKIIRLTVQTGLVTALFATADVVIFLTVDVRIYFQLPNSKSNPICRPSQRVSHRNFFWDLALSKLYTNSLLSTLNARAGWDRLTGQEDDDVSNVLFRKDTIPRTTDVLELETNPRHQVMTLPTRLSTHTKRPTLDGNNTVVVHQVVESLSDGEVYGTEAFKSENAEKV